MLGISLRANGTANSPKPENCNCRKIFKKEILLIKIEAGVKYVQSL